MVSKLLRGMFLAAAAAAIFTAGSAMAKEGDVLVKLETNKGDIVLELYQEKAPKTVENFLDYVKEGFYNGTIFHRVINGFMIQGGGLTPDMEQKETRSPVENEADNKLTNDKYTVAMARTMDPNSATSQFFINVGDNPHLNHQNKTPQGWGYTVFGKVVDGFDVVDEIAKTPTWNKGMHQNVPVKPVIIEKAEVVEE